jgi:hypothetical protein
MNPSPMNQHYSMRKLYAFAHQWIEDRQRRGMDEAEANKLVPIISDFLSL